MQEVEQYVVGRIEKAAREVADNAVEKIESGDTILTYAASFCVQSTLITAHMSGKRFKVSCRRNRMCVEGAGLT